jgi:hypothetical protein
VGGKAGALGMLKEPGRGETVTTGRVRRRRSDEEALMRVSVKLSALAVIFGLFSAGTVGAAAFLPLEQMGQSYAAALASGHAFQTQCIKRPCRFDAVKLPSA